jgi:hypothetical protein
MKVLKRIFQKQWCLCLGMSWMALAMLPAETERLELPENIRLSMREVAMPEMGDSKLEKLLSRYYELGLGGAETWEGITSMRLKGSILIGGQRYKLLCYQRKPDLLKMILSGKSGKVELGYDGKVAWQYFAEGDLPASEMPPLEARRFIHSSVFGNYLIYPYREGKTIDDHGTVRERGTVCHHIRVTLPSEYRVDYYIDIRNYLETKILNYDDKNGELTTLICEDFRMVNGFPVAFKVTSTPDNGEISVLSLDQVDFNIGLTDWIFQKPM